MITQAPNPASTTDVLIVGAGPTGLTAATLLARYGVDFRIVDKNAAAVKKSQALVVQARTLELWDKLGLAAGAVRRGQPLADVKFINKNTVALGGKPFMALERDGKEVSPYPYLLVYEQYKTEKMLLTDLAEHTGPNAAYGVERNTEIRGLEPLPNGVTVTLRHEDGSDELVFARYLIAADGASSFIRKTLGLEFGGATYADRMLVADVDLDWSLGRDEFYMQLPRQGLIAFLPMRGEGYSDTQYRIIARLPTVLEQKDELTGEDIQSLIDEHTVIKAKVTAARWVSKYIIHRRMTKQFRVGRIFLAGDAAHIHSPSGGQGMNTGIQDAWNLAWKLALVVRGQANTQLLESYEAERIPIAKAILNGSDRGFTFIGSSNRVFHLLRSTIVPRLSSVTSLNRVGKNVFKFISQTWIDYRKSPAVGGDKKAKKARPGDRTPYAHLTTGESIFSTMRGVNHHLLLFVSEAQAKQARTRLESCLTEFAVAIDVQVIDMAQHAVRDAYSINEPTALLIRPDGHIAWRGSLAKPDALTAYLDKFYVRRSTAQAAAPLAEKVAVSSLV